MNRKLTYRMRSNFIRSGIRDLWVFDYDVLVGSAIEIGVNLDFFAAELDLDVSRRYLLADEIALFQEWLKVRGFPEWEPCPASVLNELAEYELFLALAKSQLDLSAMTAQHTSSPEMELEHCNLALYVSERALAHAELLAHANARSRLS